MRTAANLRRTRLQNVLPIGAIHQQANDLRIGQERAAVGMVGAHHHSPRIVHQQIPFEPDGPLQRMHQRFVLVLDGRDAAARFHFGIAAEPLAAVDLRQEITQRSVARHAGRFAEQHLADVDRDVGVRVDVVGQRHHFAVERVFVAIAAAVAVKLDMRDVAAMTFQSLHRFQRRFPVAGHAQVVAVNMHRMRQAQFGGGLSHAADDLPRRHVEMIDLRIETADVAGLMRSSRLRRRRDSRASERSLWWMPAASR